MGVELQNVLDALLPNPAFVTNERLDIIGWTRTASRIFADYASLPAWERNLAWLIFTDPEQRKIYVQRPASLPNLRTVRDNPIKKTREHLSHDYQKPSERK
ncbi:hypothetical protein [Ktedonobacter sp. SOSP1-52]|uniref:MmyB family transcriptional regulator n=1 Tax=Ktedonobacter sp. SOSP1-52 TaxID=2778366 RepID=UPI0035B088D7